MFALAAPASAASSLPDPNTPASLTITKHEAPASGAAADGTKRTDLTQKTIDGVTFSTQKITGIDLATSAGWLDANALSAAYNGASIASNSDAENFITTFNSNAYGLGTAASQVTGAANPGSGEAVFSNLSIGLYLVEETNSPANVASPSAPFVVALPMTDPTNSSQWMYDVYVYPKNAVTNVTKTVDDSNATKIGDSVTWTITGDIPASTGPGDVVTGYQITDKLDPKLDYVSATAALSAGPSLTAGTDYNATYDSGTRVVKVLFTQTGLDKLTANRSAQVVVTVTTTVNAVGEIANSADLYPNDSSITNNTGIHTDTDSTTKFGAATLLKTGPDGKTPLTTGASFQVYSTLDDAKAGNNPIVISGQDTWTTGADGKVVISGLRYSNFIDGKEMTDPDGTLTPSDPTDDWQHYYLVETKAPAGYELNATPIAFDVTSENGSANYDVSVPDVEANAGFHLPLTGGTGSTLIYVAGLGLLIIAGLVALTKRRRHSDHSGR
jgi:fimbrial isopeptide formation D2 family protein/LPXTG-motif cell wall-anchored protein